MKIGIPRALIYWKRPIFWESFFEGLGFDVLLSPNTNKKIVEMGVNASDPETCFSVKVFFGHLLWLDGKCDPIRKSSISNGVNLIFVPRMKANEGKLEYCPKFFALPDLAKIMVKTPILTATFDERKEKFETTLQKLGKKLKRNKKEVKRATETAFLKEKELREKEEKEFFEKIKSEKRKIILISHPYNLQDEYVNLRLEEKLEKLGAEVIFIDEVPNKQLTTYNLQQITTKKQKLSVVSCQLSVNFHWEFGKEIMGKIDELFEISRAKNVQISGAVEISSFPCGCDAVLKEFVEREFKQRKTPFLYLMIDEQTGEVGFQTRLEAFIDTL